MKYTVALAFGIGANALVAREAAQCVQLKASGGASGVLGQLDDGQNRIGGGHPSGCYCLGSDTGFTDSKGRGCILTPPTTQFQCDVGANPTSGFKIGSSGSVTYGGSGKFYACPVNDNGEYNVYTTAAPNQDKCVEISLESAGSCGSGGAKSSMPAPAPSKPAQSPPAYASMPPQAETSPCDSATEVTQTIRKTVYQSSPAAETYPAQPSKPAPQQSQPAYQPSQPAPAPKPTQPSPPSNACPADLNGNYQYPHLIVPVNSAHPSTAYGTSYFGTVNSTTCSIFNFDIPSSYSSSTCTLVFLFPSQKDLQTSSYTVSGNGEVSFAQCDGAASEKTTWSNMPAKKSGLGSWAVAPGGEYVVASGPCAAGQTVSYEMCSEGDFALNYFQDYNPSPIGLYVREC